MYASIAFGMVVTAFVIVTVQCATYLRDGFWGSLPIYRVYGVLGMQPPGPEWGILHWLVGQEVAIMMVVAAGLVAYVGRWLEKREERRYQRLIKGK